LDGLTVLAVFALARQALGGKVSLLVSGMYACSSFAVFYAQEARQYALFALLATLSSYFFYRIAVGEKGTCFYHYIFYVLATAGALYSFPYALLVLSAQGLYVLVAGSRRFHAHFLHGIRARGHTWHAGICLLFSFVLYLPCFILLIRRGVTLYAVQGAYAGGPARMGSTLLSLPAIARRLTYGFHVPFTGSDWEGILFTLLFVVTPVVLGVLLLRRARGAQIYLVCIFGVSLAWALIMPFRVHVPEAKHFIFLLPFVFIAMCAPLSHGRGRYGGRLSAAPLAAGLLVVAVFAGVQAYALEGYYARPVEKERWREFTPALAERLQSGDLIIFSPFQGAVPFEYYLPDNVERDTGPFAGRRWRITKEGGRVVRFSIETPVRDVLNGLEYYTSEEWERILDPRRRPRVWLVTNHSNVAREAPRVSEALERALAGRYDEVRPEGLREEYAGSVGTIRVRLLVRRRIKSNS